MAFLSIHPRSSKESRFGSRSNRIHDHAAFKIIIRIDSPGTPMPYPQSKFEIVDIFFSPMREAELHFRRR